MPTPTFPEVIRFADCEDQPWANGGGSTRVIAIESGDAAAPFDWRLSVATVSSGEFSRFPGVDRVIVLVDGPTMTLTIDGVDHALDLFRPKRFRGESAVTCRTERQSLDFNVMARREVCNADVSIRVGSGHISAPLDCRTFLVALAGSATVRSAGGRIALKRFDSVLLRSAAELSVAPQGRVAVVRFSRPGRR